MLRSKLLAVAVLIFVLGAVTLGAEPPVKVHAEKKKLSPQARQKLLADPGEHVLRRHAVEDALAEGAEEVRLLDRFLAVEQRHVGMALGRFRDDGPIVTGGGGDCRDSRRLQRGQELDTLNVPIVSVDSAAKPRVKRYRLDVATTDASRPVVVIVRRQCKPRLLSMTATSA